MNISISLWVLPFALFSINLLISRSILPYLEKVKSKNGIHDFNNSVLVSVLATSNDFIRLAAFTYLLFALLVLLIKLTATVGGQRYADTIIDITTQWHETLDNWQYLQITSFLAAAIALTILIYRRRKGYYREWFEARLYQTEANLRSGKQEYRQVPPTNEMLDIEKHLAVKKSQLKEVRQLRLKVPDPKLTALIERIEEEMQPLRNAWYIHSLVQQIPVEPTKNQPTTLWEDLLTILSSRGLFNTFSGMGSLLTKVIAVLWFVALLSMQTNLASGNISEALSQQQLDRDLMRAREQFTAVLTQNEGANPELTDEDERYLDAFAADFEISLAASLTNSPSTEDEIAFELRSMAVRAEILRRYVLAGREETLPDSVPVAGIDSSGQAAVTHDPTQDLFSGANEPQSHASRYLSFQRAYYRQWRSPGPSVSRPGPAGKSKNPYQRKQKANSGQVSPPPQTRAAHAAKAPRTKTGYAFRENLRKVATESQPLWETMKAKARMHKAAFFEPVELRELTKLFVVDGIGEWAKGELSFLYSNELTDAINAATWEKLHDKIFYEHLNNLARGESYADVLENMRTRSPKKTFSSSKYAKMADHLHPDITPEIRAVAAMYPPSLKIESSRAHTQATLALLDELNENQRSTSSLRPLNTYDDIFPGQLGSETRTATGEALTEVGEAIADLHSGPRRPSGGGGGGLKFDKAVLKANFSRARNYRSLRGFSRVGGVLIGDNPKAVQGTPARIIGFRWNLTAANQLTLWLRQQGGSEIPVGSFPADIVQQALVYAADGRPTTVTMVKALETAPLKILLHPALLNTRLGLEATQLDRLVDMYQSEGVKQARLDVQRAAYLYQTAYLQRSLNLLSKGENPLPESQDSLRSYLQRIMPSHWQMLEPVWQQLKGKNLNDARAFPFAAKPDFFDHHVVELLCAHLTRRGTSYSQFYQELIAELEHSYSDSILTASTSLLPAAYEVWSGVREQPYVLDAALSFLQPSSKASNTALITYPFQFIVQTALTTPPTRYLSYKGEDVPDTVQTYVDKDPWQFPILQSQLSADVAAPIQNIRETRQIIERMRQFTLLQRVFRLAFEGKLGLHFPLEKLLAIQAATRKAVIYQATPEWNAPKDWSLIQHLVAMRQQQTVNMSLQFPQSGPAIQGQKAD